MYKHFGYGSNVSYTKMWSDMMRVMYDGTNTKTLLDPCYLDLDTGVLARLDGYKIAITDKGASTIRESKGDHVIGVLYELEDAQIDRLKVSEKMKNYGTEVSVRILGKEETTEAWTWIWVSSTDKDAKVRKYYFELIAEALQARGIDDYDIEYIDNYLMPIMVKHFRVLPKNYR